MSTGIPRSARNDMSTGIPRSARNDMSSGIPRSARNDMSSGIPRSARNDMSSHLQEHPAVTLQVLDPVQASLGRVLGLAKNHRPGGACPGAMRIHIVDG